MDESYIWPDALGRDEVAAVSESEVVAVWPHRWAVPRDTWGHLFSQAEREIGVLVYAGHVHGRGHRACSGCLADGPGPGSGSGCCWVTRTAATWPSAAKTRASARRVAAKVRNALVLFRPLLAERGRGDPAARHGAVQLDLPRR